MNRPGDEPNSLKNRDSDNSWYLSPQGNRPPSSTSTKCPSKRRYEESEKGKQEAEIDDTSSSNQKLSKEDKKRRRLEGRIAKASINNAPSATDVRTADGTSKDNIYLKDKNLRQAVPSISSPQNATETEAGLPSGSTSYTSLGNIRYGQTTSLIGVVINFSQPKRTSTGDLMRWVQIVDSSIYDTKPVGIKINCFSKRYEEWLPAADYGVILILSNVKIQRYRDSLVGTGYHDKLGWAVCSPLNQINHGPPSSAPRSEGLAEDGLTPFTPFYQPTHEEILYCVKVSDWWRDIQKPALYKEPPAPNQGTRKSGSVRVHRLISEAGPDVPPQGYFNCTVEILKGFKSDFKDVYSLFVTDYSKNEDTAPLEYRWCPVALTNYVLLIEMWDAASQMGSSMRPGDFYQMDNVRMKWNHQNRLEGKIQQNKIYHLEPQGASVNPHLKALLERKRKWEEEQHSMEHEISYRCIRDFEKTKFFHCAVEVLQTISTKDQKPCLYITDYTTHPSMESLVVNEPWAQGLNGYMVKLFLEGEQQQMAESITAGSFYCIRKLRLNYSTIEACVCGHLGGSEKLISKANPNKTDNEHLNGLLRRKETWENQVRRKCTQPVVVEERRQLPINSHRDHPRKKETIHDFMRFQDIPPATVGRLRLNVFAKVVSFHPLDLDDALYQFCSRCQVVVPLKQRACLKCEDFEHEYIEYKYQLYMFIEDEAREQILVSVNDTSPIWKGLKRTPLREDKVTREKFRATLGPLLGNLPLVHEAYIAGKSLGKQTSFHVLELDGWITADMERAYVLRNYD